MTHNHEVGRADRLASSFLGEHFPIAPEAVRNAVGHFLHSTKISEQASTEQQLAIKTTNILMSDFCSRRLTPQAYDGAMLAPLVKATRDLALRDHALDALHIYVTTSNQSYEDMLFALGLAADQIVIDDYQKNLIERLYPASDQPWAQAPVGATPRDLLPVRTELGANIESELIANASLLRWFLSHNASNYADALQWARSAESFHAPMSEIIGFDGMAMAQQSQLGLMRLDKLGQQKYIDQARLQLQNLTDPNIVDETIHDILTTIRGYSSHKQPLKHGESHGIMIGEGETGPEKLRTVWRVKSLGRIAEKLYKLQSFDNLTDIIGITTITENAYQSGQVIANTLEKIIDNEHLSLRSSPKRNTPVHVRGGATFVHDVARGMGYSGISQLRNYADVHVTCDGDYQVAKLAFEGQRGICGELQTNRAEDRVAARIGTPNHAFYRLTGRNATPEEAEAVAQMNSRVKFLGINGLTQQSRQRAEELLREIYAHAENR